VAVNFGNDLRCGHVVGLSWKYAERTKLWANNSLIEQSCQ
jgi:hypothetical protein